MTLISQISTVKCHPALCDFRKLRVVGTLQYFTPIGMLDLILRASISTYERGLI